MVREYNEMKKKQNMGTYCFNCKKYTANENSSARKTKQNRLMLLSNYAICGKKNTTFIKN